MSNEIIYFFKENLINVFNLSTKEFVVFLTAIAIAESLKKILIRTESPGA